MTDKIQYVVFHIPSQTFLKKIETKHPHRTSPAIVKSSAAAGHLRDSYIHQEYKTFRPYYRLFLEEDINRIEGIKLTYNGSFFISELSRQVKNNPVYDKHQFLLVPVFVDNQV